MEFPESYEPISPRGSVWLNQSPGPHLVPPASFASYPPQFISGSSYYFTDYSLPSDQGSEPYGATSVVQFPYYTHHGQPRKRRRLDQQAPMSPRNPSSSPVADKQLEERLIDVAKEEEGDDHRLHRRSTGSWLAAAVSSAGSPFSKGVAHISSALCPCCGFEPTWKASEGYRAIPDTPVIYNAEHPYVMEKPPYVPNLPIGPYAQSDLGSNEPRNPPLSLETFDTRNERLLLISADTGDQNQAHATAAGYYPTPRSSYNAQCAPITATGIPGSLVDAASPPPAYPAAMDKPSSSTICSPSSEYSARSQINHYTILPSRVSRVDIRNGGLQEDDQPSFDILQPYQRGGKRGPFKDASLREQTAQTRKRGSCIRCRTQRIRCEHNEDEPDGPCLTCKKVANTKAGRFPCLRYKITDVRLYKPGQVPGYEWTSRWSNGSTDPIQRWASTEIKTIHVADGYSDNTMVLRVRQFIPQEGDKLERTWCHGGTRMSVVIPPFALVDIEEGKKAYMGHIHGSMNQAFTNILGRPGGLLNKTYHQALQCCKDKSMSMDSLELLRETFKLWMSVRLSTRSTFIVGEETLGMSQNLLDDTSPTPNKTPLPPVLGAQLDMILIHHIQNDLRRKVLDRLEKMVSKRKHNTWMVTYLVTFILLHNTALITAHDASYAHKHGMNRRFAREDKVKDYHLGANILLAHFHYCNKGVHPFSDECKDQDLRTLAGLDEGQIQFVHLTRAFVRRNRKEWEDLQASKAYEDDYFFVSQLFEENWQPRSTL